MHTREWRFRKSSYSAATSNNCVEVADILGGDAALRDSQNPEQGHLVLPCHEWGALLGVLRSQRV